jgi:Family of unknown function (DUF6101)
LGRQATTGRVIPAGSSRGERLDPFALPLRFVATDHAADERVRVVELHREAVVLRRALRGIKMAVRLPLATFLGVALRLVPPTIESTGAVAVVLEHPDPALSLELCRAVNGGHIIAEWQSWGRTLRLPLLVVDADGHLRDPFERMGAVRIGATIARRRRRSPLHRRRPSLPLRRPAGQPEDFPIVHRAEREIIARN